MRFKVGQKVRVVKPYTKSGFKDGDIVEISKIEDEGSDYPYYKAKLCSNEQVLWYLDEGEVEAIEIGEDEFQSIESEDKPVPITNADKIRAMSNRELAEFLFEADYEDSACVACPHKKDFCTINGCIDGYESWLNSEAE